MKASIKYLSIIFIIFSILSCKKEESPHFVKATIDGSEYHATNAAAHFPASSNKGILNIKSSTNDGRTLNIIINGYSGPKRYSFNSEGNSSNRALCTYSQTGENKASIIYTTNDDDDNGFIIIEKLENSVVKGTFEFTAYTADNKKSVTVTNGIFKAHF